MSDTASALSESASLGARRLRVAIGRLRRRLHEAYDAQELSMPQVSVLSRLEKDGPASIGELAAAERVRQQSVGATLAVLAERGLIERRPDPHDARRVVISLTPAGRESIVDKRTAGEQWLALTMQHRLTEAEREQLLAAIALMDRLTD
jgi:DNA-binding MarR family transcriptional regulator